MVMDVEREPSSSWSVLDKLMESGGNQGVESKVSEEKEEGEITDDEANDKPEKASASAPDRGTVSSNGATESPEKTVRAVGEAENTKPQFKAYTLVETVAKLKKTISSVKFIRGRTEEESAAASDKKKIVGSGDEEASTKDGEATASDTGNVTKRDETDSSPDVMNDSDKETGNGDNSPETKSQNGDQTPEREEKSSAPESMTQEMDDDDSLRILDPSSLSKSVMNLVSPVISKSTTEETTSVEEHPAQEQDKTVETGENASARSPQTKMASPAARFSTQDVVQSLTGSNAKKESSAEATVKKSSTPSAETEERPAVDGGDKGNDDDGNRTPVKKGEERRGPTGGSAKPAPIVRRNSADTQKPSYTTRLECYYKSQYFTCNNCGFKSQNADTFASHAYYHLHGSDGKKGLANCGALNKPHDLSDCTTVKGLMNRLNKQKTAEMATVKDQGSLNLHPVSLRPLLAKPSHVGFTTAGKRMILVPKTQAATVRVSPAPSASSSIVLPGAASVFPPYRSSKKATVGGGVTINANPPAANTDPGTEVADTSTGIQKPTSIPEARQGLSIADKSGDNSKKASQGRFRDVTENRSEEKQEKPVPDVVIDLDSCSDEAHTGTTNGESLEEGFIQPDDVSDDAGKFSDVIDMIKDLNDPREDASAPSADKVRETSARVISLLHDTIVFVSKVRKPWSLVNSQLSFLTSCVFLSNVFPQVENGRDKAKSEKPDERTCLPVNEAGVSGTSSVVQLELDADFSGEDEYEDDCGDEGQCVLLVCRTFFRLLSSRVTRTWL